MTLIKVPRPPESAFNKERPVSSLLRTQLEHLQRAEFRLPGEQQTNIYINAIKTEGAAADYIRKVTTAIHDAHVAEVGSKAKPKTKRGIAIAAAAATPKKKQPSASKTITKSKAGSKRKKK